MIGNKSWGIRWFEIGMLSWDSCSCLRWSILSCAVFNLEKTFKTTFSLLVLHMWLCLHRLKEEGKEGVEFGQYLYEIYNHDLELRVSKAGVNLLLTRWMKDLEKIFYGNIVAYDTAMLPEAKPDELPNVIWRNVFSDGDSSMPKDDAKQAAKAMARYAHREASCLSLTGSASLLVSFCLFSHFENSCSLWRTYDSICSKYFNY